MFEALGAKKFALKPYEAYNALALEAIKEAIPLNDEPLNADLYIRYGTITDSGAEDLSYNIKALEIQKRYGFENFHFSQVRLQVVSGFLYDLGQYRQSIELGFEGVRLWESGLSRYSRHYYILQLDVLGADYKRLGMPDSSYYYYQKIYDSIQAAPLDDTYAQSMWLGISKGNIGQYYARRKNYGRALPLIQDYLQTSITWKDTFNIAMAQNSLGNVYFEQGNYHLAKSAWKQAREMAETNSAVYFLYQLNIANKGLSSVYKAIGNTDSTAYYYERYHETDLKLVELQRDSFVPKVSARLVLDSLQFSAAKAVFEKTKTRDRSLGWIGLLVLIVVLTFLFFNLRGRKK